MCEKMTPQISFNLLPLKDEYLANTTRYYETESVLKMYIRMMSDLNSKWTNDFVIKKILLDSGRRGHLIFYKLIPP